MLYKKLVVQRTPSPLYHRLSPTEQLTIPFNKLHCSERFSFPSLFYTVLCLSLTSFLRYTIPYPLSRIWPSGKNPPKIEFLFFKLTHNSYLYLQQFNKFYI